MRKFLIYMASGSSSRFGKNKLLQNLRGKPVFAYGLEALEQAAARTPDCTVVVVSRYPQIRAYAAQRGIPAVDCPESAKGASFTIRAGIAWIPHPLPTDYLLFCVADQPYLNPDSICALLEKADGKTVTARLVCGDRPGNPVLFSAMLIPELQSLRGDQGGGAVAKRHACTAVPIRSAREFLDLDEETDLMQILEE